MRFVGSGARPRTAPRGEAWDDAAETLATTVDAVPEAASLPSRTLVFVLPDTRGTGLLSAFGRKSAPRHARCAALLHAGYVEITAEIDAASRLDVVLGRTP